MIYYLGFLAGLLALDSTSAYLTNNSPISSRQSTSFQAARTKDVVYDGPEWTSIQDSLGLKTSSPTTSYGKMTVVVGVRQDSGDKIVGVVADSGGADTVSLQGSNLHVYSESTAKLPSSGVKDEEAMNTMIAALTGVECTLPRVEGVGGSLVSEENSMVSGKVVILGGSEYACFAAKGLAALGSQVSLVSTNDVKLQHGNVEILPPAVGEEEVGFATHIGEFDSLLDTADDERPNKRFAVNDDDEEDPAMSRGTTLRLLQQRHKCDRYVSSMTKAQDIVNREGVLWGPGKVKNHVKEIQQQLSRKPATFQSIVPPPSFGKTVETLLQKGVLYTSNKDFVTQNDLTVRGWSLKDFMETSMWPTDSSGGGSRTVRFGLPVLEEEEAEEEEFAETSTETTYIDQAAWDAGVRKEQSKLDDQDMKNPFVKKIVGEQQMYETIVKEERDCVLFMSATFCRTCKQLNPRFTTKARQTMESYGEDEKGILFAKADATGEVGKDLSRLLNVDAVPAFLLFRKGRRYGPAMSISRMPSQKLDAAIEMLQSGRDWDVQAIQNADV